MDLERLQKKIFYEIKASPETKWAMFSLIVNPSINPTILFFKEFLNCGAVKTARILGDLKELGFLISKREKGILKTYVNEYYVNKLLK